MYYVPFIFLLVLVMVILALDAIARSYNRKTGQTSSYFIEVIRKATHTTGGVMFAFAPYLGITTIGQYSILLAGMLILTLNEQKLFIFKEMRPGALKYTWAFACATGVLMYYQYYLVFTLACLIYAIPDSLAALVGRAVGKPIKILGGKSIAGFLAFAISAAVILSFAHINMMFVVSIALLLAVVELFAKGGSDNFFCPTLAAILLYLHGVH